MRCVLMYESTVFDLLFFSADFLLKQHHYVSQRVALLPEAWPASAGRRSSPGSRGVESKGWNKGRFFECHQMG